MTEELKLNGTMQLAGRFHIKAVNKDGSERILADWFDNLILDSGLNRVGSGGVFIGVAVGTGTTTPAVTQTALVNQVAYTSTQTGTDVSGSDVSGGFMYLRRTYRFGAGSAAGNLTEVGAGWASGQMFSRTLIKDGGGNPTTITVLSDEYLDVTYEIRIYWPTTDSVATINISGTNYTVTCRADIVGSWNGSSGGILAFAGGGVTNAKPSDPMVYNATSIGDIQTAATGTFLGYFYDQTFDTAYANNSYKRTIKQVISLNAVTSSFNLIRVYTTIGMHKIHFNPSIPKTNANIFTFKFDIAWARKA